MRKSEALALAAQLNIQVKGVRDFEDKIESMGLEIAMDNATGDWVVIRKGDRDGAELARVA